MSDHTARPRQTYVFIDELASLDWEEIIAQVGALDFHGEVWVSFDLDEAAAERAAYDRFLASAANTLYYHEDAGPEDEAAEAVGLDAAPRAIIGLPITTQPIDRWPPIRGPPAKPGTMTVTARWIAGLRPLRPSYGRSRPFSRRSRSRPCGAPLTHGRRSLARWKPGRGRPSSPLSFAPTPRVPRDSGAGFLRARGRTGLAARR